MSRRKPVFYVKWGAGEALELEVGKEYLIVRGDNVEITFEPRSVHVEAEKVAVREYSDEKRKRVYIDVPEGIRGVQAPRVDIDSVQMVGNFELRVVDLPGIERYLTILTPAGAGFIYDYAIITTSTIMIEMKARRKTYQERVDEKAITIYIV